jgi:GMP reductase
MVSTGINDSDFNKLKAIIVRINPMFVCIDVANGYIEDLTRFVIKVRAMYPSITIMVGNVVTGETSRHLIMAGADIVKVGVGSGSVCLTRRVTGCGYPQFSAIMETSAYLNQTTGFVCGDGGVQYPGDLVKGFGAGAGFMMIGSLLAGHKECLGELIEDPETKQVHKVFYGMSSRKAMEKHAGGVSDYRTSEGKVVNIPYKGPVEHTILHILGGVRSGMTYTNSIRLEQIHTNAIFIRVNNQVNHIYK